MKNANVTSEELLGNILIWQPPKRNVKRPWASSKRQYQQNYREEAYTMARILANTLRSSKVKIVKAHKLLLKHMWEDINLLCNRHNSTHLSVAYKKLFEDCASLANLIEYGFLANPTAVNYRTLAELVKISARIRERKTVQKLWSTY